MLATRKVRILLLFIFLAQENVYPVMCNIINRNTLILMCFDGFRWDYPDKYNLPNFKHVMNEGVRAESMKSCFPTKTFPNLVTLVTGLYPESHGITANKMYDPVFQEISRYTTNDPKWFRGFEPIWITNERAVSSKANRSRKSAVIQWGAADVKFNGMLPWFYQGYNETHTSSQGFSTVLNLLDTKDRPNLILVYFEEADGIGHKYGPNSTELKKALDLLDKQLGHFLKELQSKGLTDEVNLVMVSDHGMAQVAKEDTVLISDILHPSWYDAVEVGVITTVWPKSKYSSRVYLALRASEHIDTYLKKDIPARYHYRHHRTIPPVLAIANPGWRMTREASKGTGFVGTHGYDNHWKHMHGIFIAKGPDFKSGVTIPSFENIHVYPLLCHILGIPALPNNGSLNVLRPVLSESSKLRCVSFYLIMIQLVITWFIAARELF